MSIRKWFSLLKASLTHIFPFVTANDESAQVDKYWPGHCTSTANTTSTDIIKVEQVKATEHFAQ